MPRTKLKLAVGAGLVAEAPGTNTPTMPLFLVGEAKAEWERIVPELDAAGLLRRTDRAALAAYCVAFGELVESSRLVEERGRVVEEPMQSATGEVIGTRLKPNPAVRLQRDALNRVKQFVSEFGLTPLARLRVRGTDEPAHDARAAKFFGAGRVGE